MRYLTRGITLAATVVILAIVLAACSGSSSDSSDSTGTEKQTYTNAQYGFEMTYTKPLSVVTTPPAANQAYSIAFADKDGPQINDQYANGVRVAVSELDQPIAAADVPKLEKELVAVFNEMIAAAPGGELTSDLTPIELNGTPGYTMDYRFTMNDKELICRFTVLIKDTYEYDITEQTVAADWDALSPTLNAAVQTFTVD